MPSAKTKRARSKKYYQQNKEKILAQRKEYYRMNAEELKACYNANSEKMKAASKRSYYVDPEKKKVASKKSYYVDPEKKKAASKRTYYVDPEKKKAASKKSYRKGLQTKEMDSKGNFAKNCIDKMSSTKRYCSKYKESLCVDGRGRYVLQEPKVDVKEIHLRDIQNNLYIHSKTRNSLIKAFKKQQKTPVNERVMAQDVCRIGASRLLTKALQKRKIFAGSLLKSTREIQTLQIKSREDLDRGCHTASSEPYFYNSSYQPVRRDAPIDENGKARAANQIETNEEEPLKWECSSECKPLTDVEVFAIVSLKEAFDKPIQEEAEVEDAEDSEVLPTTSLLERLQSTSADAREFACASLSNLMLNSLEVPKVLRADAVRCLAPLLLDESAGVQEAAAGALRNMSVSGGVNVCKIMVQQDVMTPLVALLRQCSTNFGLTEEPVKGNRGKNSTELVAFEAIHLLWNLCECSPTAVAVFNKEYLFPLLLQSLMFHDRNIELSIAAAHCLNTVTEDNPELVASISPESLVVLEAYLTPQGTEKQLMHFLLLSLIMGTLWNLQDAFPAHSRAEALIAMTRVLGTILDVDVKQEHHRLAAEKMETQPEVTTPTKSRKQPKSQSQIKNKPQESETGEEMVFRQKDHTADSVLEQMMAILLAQQTALEVIVNMCYKDESLDEAKDDWEIKEPLDDLVYGHNDVYCPESEVHLTPLCFTAEVHDVLVNHDIPHKVLKKTTNPDWQYLELCQQNTAWAPLIAKLRCVQCRALTCLDAIITVLGMSGLGEEKDLQELAQHLSSLAFTHFELNKDESFLEAVTGSIRSFLHLLADRNVPECMTPEQLLFLCHEGLKCESADVRRNVLAIMGVVGNKLAQMENTMETLKGMGNCLLQTAQQDASLVVAGAALDTIFDVFGEGAEADKVANEIELVSALRNLAPSFMSMMQEHKRNYSCDEVFVLQDVATNLLRFIRYKEQAAV
uniref:HEAT repeat containing 3 n=1 Tax=Eptatretus burgeri TaxID=7764 RepID=A0A8C4QJA5_EPTBU